MNVMGWFTMIVQLFQLLPSILAMVKQAEEIIGSGNGAVKKAIVMAPFQVVETPPALTAAVSTLVDNIVTQQNKIVPVVAQPVAMVPKV